MNGTSAPISLWVNVLFHTTVNFYDGGGDSGREADLPAVKHLFVMCTNEMNILKPSSRIYPPPPPNQISIADDKRGDGVPALRSSNVDRGSVFRRMHLTFYRSSQGVRMS